MARNESELMTVRYPMDGAIEELRGKTFEVPRAVSNKAEWLESQFREEEAKQIAAREREERDKRVLNDRIERQVAAEASLPTERLAAVEAEVKTLRRAQVDLPSTMELEGISQKILQSHNSLFNGQQFLQTAANTLEKQAEELAVNTELTEAQRQEALELQRQAVQVARNSQEFMNLLQEEFSKERASYEALIAELQAALSDAQAKVAVMAPVLAMAERVIEAAPQEQQRKLQVYVDGLEATYERKFLDFMGLVCTTLGISAEQLTVAANQIDQDPRSAVVIDQNVMSFYIGVMQASRGLKEGDKQLVDEAFAATAKDSTGRREVVIS
jgi:hypothetical protein